MKDVAFSCDDNGAKFLRVTVWSLLHHYTGDEPIRINVFEGFGGHSAESKSKLEALVGEWNKKRKLNCAAATSGCDFFSVRYINVEKAIEPYADLIMNREGSRWNVFTWTPIFTPVLISDAAGNVAHFDIDMLFNDDVSKILDLDLGDNLIAAVAEYGKGDPVITDAVWGKGILPPEALCYFNTGTIVFNTAKCREERTWERILAWYRDHYDIADRIEQDAWNALYWKRTKLLPLRWNFHDRLIKRFAHGDVGKLYWNGNPSWECLEAAQNPAILHFWGPKKPWKPSHRPYRKLYHAAMEAVGMVAPKDPVSAVWNDFLSQRRLLKIARLRETLSPESILARWKRAWGWRLFLKRVEWLLLAPFEMVGGLCAICLLAMLPHRLMLAVCDGLAALVYLADRHGRRLALSNLRVLMGSGSVRRELPPFDPDVSAFRPSRRERLIIRGSYRNMVRSVGHAFWTIFGARGRVRATGIMSARCRCFLAGHNPAVTVSGHIGCWEILSQLAVLEGHRMMSVAKRIGVAGVTWLLRRARSSIGQEIVLADGAFRSLLRGIRAGKSLGLLVDQHVDSKRGGVWVRFLGRPMSVSAAPAFFAAKGGMPILVAWSRPLRDGRYRCEWIDEIAADETGDSWATTQRCTRDLERVIRRHPSCWVMNYNFFKGVPTDADLRTLAVHEVGSLQELRGE